MAVNGIRHLFQSFTRTGSACLYCPDQEILRCMFHINKFQNLRTVSLRFQKFCTDSVCKKCRHSFFQKSIFQHRRKQFILNLVIQFMLTAWNRQYHLRIPLNLFGKCIIGCFVTCMERYHHIYFLHTFIFRNITTQKMQFLISVFFCQSIAFPDHIFLQVQPNDINVISFEFLQIIIHGKCQI